MARRALVVVASETRVGAVQFHEGQLSLTGAAVEVFEPLRERFDDATLGEDLIANGWSNGYLMLSAIEE